MRKLTLILIVLLLAIPLSAQNSPEGVVRAFLDAWNNQDYAEMYRYLHPRSQEIYPQQVFESRYTVAQDATAMTGLSYEIGTVRLQGQSATVRYNINMASGSFGSIEDRGRLIRLMQTGSGWRIAWSSMDIFDTLAGEATLRVETIPRSRANIYDRDGEVIAGDTGETTALFSSRQNMNSVDDCIDLITRLNRESRVTLEQRFGNRTPDNIFFLTALDAATYEANSDDILFTCGVDPATQVFTTGPHRDYYGGSAMPHAVGYVGQVQPEQLEAFAAEGYVPGSDLVGQAGVEAAYERTLAGDPERALRVVDPSGTILNEVATSTGEPPLPVTVTLDRELQLITAQAISDAFNYAAGNWGSSTVSSGGAAVVLDVNTGGILALTSYPLIDPNLFIPDSAVQDRGILLQQLLADPRDPIRNRATNEQQSPGSTFKLITAAAVLNEGIIGQDETYFCDLYWDSANVGGTTGEKSDWRVAEAEPMPAAGEITPAEAIMASCNPFFWQFGGELYNQYGANTLVEYSQRMGLGRTYGIDGLPEVSGAINTPASIDAAVNESVGQGDVAVPPLQMALMTAAIANGGTLYKPYLVQQVGGVDGTPIIETNEPEVVGTLDFNPGVLETLREGMCGVTTNEEFGTAYIRFGDPTAEYHFPTEYSICGKTGTAQTGRYPNAWFVAYAPADDPQLAIAVMVEQSLEGSQVAAPIVRRILDDYFNQPRANFPEWWNTEPYLPLNVPPGGGSG